ncbi:hypothetical protein GCM10017608_26320 [Agromyces luteolus]|uniref:Uncharacterized protein n=1 Tax=Agromyces luteolus TaxID=88373 RepID=A0A7C9HT45_9MICO|nr:hypothetical protein [Agromyces luteolus]MUN09009.1 hypothetical protein [Agromyces luteolus]GLK28697.1 hypothetical protein GCM10017608_26320 [Agromyces luteolus]
MTEKPIKVDAATDQTVSELAYFLRTTKKAVVATAVADYAEQRDRYLETAEIRSDADDEPGRHGTGRGRDARPTILHLAPLERLALRRRELARAFAERGAGDIRIFDTGRAESGEAQLVLLAETDPVDGGQAAWDLSRVASRLLGVRVEVISTTMLGLFDPGGLRAALERSRAL